MKSEIEDMIKKCATCLTFRNRQPTEPIINHPMPNQAWKLQQILFAYTDITNY